MEFEFINRVWLPNLGRSKARKDFLFVLGGIVLLLHLFMALMDGFDSVNWFVGLVVPALLISIGLMGTRRGGYASTGCKLTVARDSVRILYPNIDRQDKKGVHSEIQIFARDSIAEIQYSEVLKSFRILGQGTFASFMTSGTEQVDYVPEGTLPEAVIYPEAGQLQQILNAFETVLGLRVQRMDDGI